MSFLSQRIFPNNPTPLMNYAHEGLGGGFNTTKLPVDAAKVGAIVPSAVADVSLASIEPAGYEGQQPA